jgi:hypothetical protein
MAQGEYCAASEVCWAAVVEATRSCPARRGKLSDYVRVVAHEGGGAGASGFGFQVPGRATPALEAARDDPASRGSLPGYPCHPRACVVGSHADCMDACVRWRYRAGMTAHQKGDCFCKGEI